MYRLITLLLCVVTVSLSADEEKAPYYFDLSLTEAVNHISTLVENQPYPDFGRRMDFLRHFIHSQTKHVIDAEHDSYAFNTPRLLNLILSHFYLGTDTPKASCGPRALAVQAVLNGMGIPTRTVHSFSSHYPEIRSHSFIEYYDKKQKRWEMMDPDYDIHFSSVYTGERLSAEQLILADTMEVVPHTFKEASTIWPLDPLYEADVLWRFYDAVMFPEKDKLVCVINSRKFPLDKRFSNWSNSTFTEFLQKQYGNVQVVVR